MPQTNRLRIVIPGGTGHLGTILARHFHEQGHSVSTITRFPRPYDWEAIHWDAESLGQWVSSFEGADAVINLAGRSLRCRHTTANKQSILRTRVRTTQLVGSAISQCSQPPRVWLNISTAGIYRRSEREMDEITGELGDGFIAEMAKAWEAAVCSSTTPETRKVILRAAPVMSLRPGREFDNWLRLVRLGLGGEVGSGDQYVAWIHDFDFIRALEFLMEQHDLAGPVNVAAPHPIPNHQFVCNIRRAWCTSYFGLPLPEWLVHTAAFVLRREPEAVLRSSRVIPQRLPDAGFSFHFPEWRGACENLVDRWRAQQTD